ncbi:MAG: hypothetical protein AB8B66_05745 [Rickettsiaceae bacterium]
MKRNIISYKTVLKAVLAISCLILLGYVISDNEKNFVCAKTSNQLPGTSICTHTRAYDPAIYRAIKEKKNSVAGTRLEILNALHNNVDGSRFDFPNGPKDVYRSAVLHSSIPCLKELVQNRGVRHIVHFEIPFLGDNKFKGELWQDTEKRYFEQLAENLGDITYTNITEYDYKNESPGTIVKRVAEIIRKIQALDDGAILIHCLGGEHKTGIVYGVMQKCINNVPISIIESEYKCHTAWRSDSKPGGYKRENIDVIRNFPCSILFDKKGKLSQ